MRAIAGIGLGLLIFFPGTVLLQWLGQDVLGLWVPMTQADACLVMIVILLSVIVVNGVGRGATSSPAQWDLNGHNARELRRMRDLDGASPTAGRRGSTTARRAARDRVDVSSVPGRSPRRTRSGAKAGEAPAPKRR